MTLKAEELIGRRIVDVIREPYQGSNRTIVGLVFEDGDVVYALSDEEGNDAGALYYSAPPDPADGNDHAGADLII